MNTRLLKLVMLILIFVIFLSNNTFAVEKTDLTAVSASPGGNWYAIMGGLAELIKQNDPNIDIKSTPGGSFVNVLRVASNEAQIGFTFPFWITQALDHSGDYATKPELEEGSLLTLAKGFGASPLQFAVTPDLAEKYGIETVKDLIDKKVPMRIAVNMPGSHEPWALQTIFEYYGATLKDVESWGGSIAYGGYTNSVQLMKDGHADLLLLDIDPPAGPFIEILVSRELKFVPMTQDAIDYMVEKQGHTFTVVPAGTYKGQDVDIPTATMMTFLITNNKVSEDVAYSIVKILLENKEKIQALNPGLRVFDPEIAWENLIAPLHPGAERVYRELGYMK